MTEAASAKRVAGASAAGKGRGGSCPAEDALAAIGDKWKIRIILSIAHRSPGRFLAMRRQLGNVHQYSLTRSLRELETDGLIARMPSALDAARKDYVLTEKGERLVPILLELSGWQENGEAAGDAARDPLRERYA